MAAGSLAAILETSNDDISGTGRPIDFVFDRKVGFSGMADQMDLLPAEPNPRGGRLPSWKFRMTISLEWVIRSAFVN